MESVVQRVCRAGNKFSFYFSIAAGTVTGENSGLGVYMPLKPKPAQPVCLIPIARKLAHLLPVCTAGFRPMDQTCRSALGVAPIRIIPASNAFNSDWLPGCLAGYVSGYLSKCPCPITALFNGPKTIMNLESISD